MRPSAGGFADAEEVLEEVLERALACPRLPPT
jgi:hypothetical protein